jgi:2-polyprenyl-3-methyl-5-hydroxy-6-metoxy-1,4-benzoquinol methylase
MTTHEFSKYEQQGAYHWVWYARNRFQYRDLVTQTLTYLPKPGTVLDVGCGDGLISYLLFKRGFEVLGIDPNMKAIGLGMRQIVRRYAWSHPWEALRWRLTKQDARRELARKGLRLEVASIYDLEETSHYDYGLCHDVIEHVADPVGLVRKLMKVVDQYAIITTPNGLYHSPKEGDYQFWTPDEFALLFEGYRAELVEVNRIRICAKVFSRSC